MRQVTASEKLRAVNEGKMAKSEFVRQMRQQFPMYVSQFNGFEDSVQILKNKGMIFEAKVQEAADVKVYDERPALNYSLDALDRGIRAELAVLGIAPGAAAIKKEDLAAATKKAKDNLEKNPTHYLDLISGESQKVDKNDKFKETKRGAKDKDTFNDMKKAELKESVTIKENIIQVAAAIKKEYGQIPGFDSLLKDYLQTHLKDINDGLVTDPVADFNDFVDLNYDRLDEQPVNEMQVNYNRVFEAIYDLAEQTELTPNEQAADVMEAIGQEFEIDFEFGAGPSRMEEKKASKDYDKDGKVEDEEEEYKGVKDRAIKSAMGKSDELKEAVKSIIKKVLTQEMISEAATAELSRIGEDYEGFEGMKSAINQLENIVTEIESFYDKTRSKIQKVYDSLGDIRNEEGLKVGGFLAPAIEAAFMKDLRPVMKKGFTNDLEKPTVRVLSKADIDAHNSGERPLGETELEQPKSTLFTPVMENKKK